jgi:outer membrane receptor protein involved in Fe transport
MRVKKPRFILRYPAGSLGSLALALLATGLGAQALAQEAAPAAPPAAEAPAAPAPAEAAPAPAAEAPAAAEPAPASGGTQLQEIIVTATRHAEALSKVPVSATAMSQETMDLKGVKDFNDIAKFTPGVTIDTNGTNAISIRGISASGGSGTTGVYIDDTPIQMRALGFNPDDTLPKTFDLDHVEVLRGPQGTLFGAGSEGGTVRYLMAQPNMHDKALYSRGEVSTTQGGAPSYELGIAGGTPIVDNVLGLRASIWYRHDGGWIDRIDPITQASVENHANYTDTVAARVAAKWAVNDSWSISPSVLFQDKNTHDVTVYWPIYSDPSSNSYKNADPDRRPEPDHYILPALKVETDFLGASFISNTSYYGRSDLSGYNGTEYNLSYFQTFAEQGLCQDGSQTTPNIVNGRQVYPPCASSTNTGGGANPSWYPLIDNKGIHLPASLSNYRAPATVTNKQNTWTEEMRLQSNDPASPLTWTAGLFYSVNRQTSVEEINDPMLPQFIQTLFNQSYLGWFGYTDPSFNYYPIPLLPNGDDYYNRNFSRDVQAALFGQVDYAFTSKLKATVGLRYAKSEVHYDHYSTGPQNFATNLNSGSEQDKPFTPKLGVSYQADQGNMYYATYAKGYRIGGANPSIPFNPCAPDFAKLDMPNGAPESYTSDTVNSYEVGAKNRFGNFRIASSAYWIRWNDIQQNVYMPGCGLQFTTNVGTAVAKGADAQLEWAPLESLSLEAAVGFTDARYVEDAAGGVVAKKGDAVVGESGTPTPPWTITLGGQYEFNAWDRKSYVRMDVTHQSQSHFLTAGEDSSTGQYDPYAFNPKATTLVSMRAGMVVDKWNVSAFIDNLFDTHPNLPPSSYAHSDVDPYSSNPPPPLIRAYTFRPRTIGVTSTYRF